MTQEELKIYQEELKQAPNRAKRNTIKRFREELGLEDLTSSVAACQCEHFMLKKK